MKVTKLSVVFAILISLVLLSGCAGGWNSSGQLVNQEGYPVTNPSPVPVVSNNLTATISGGNITITGGNITAVVTSSNTSIISPVDNVTGDLIFVTQEHHEVHDGEYFYTAYVSDVGNGANLTLAIYNNHATGSVHLLIEADSESEVAYYLYGSSVLANNGTALAVVNRNRISTNTPHNLVWHTPTVTSYGTQLDSKHWGSGKGVGGTHEDAQEWILKNNTMYTVVLINQTVNPNQEVIALGWYETH